MRRLIDPGQDVVEATQLWRLYIYIYIYIYIPGVCACVRDSVCVLSQPRRGKERELSARTKGGPGGNYLDKQVTLAPRCCCCCWRWRRRQRRSNLPFDLYPFRARALSPSLIRPRGESSVLSFLFVDLRFFFNLTFNWYCDSTVGVSLIVFLSFQRNWMIYERKGGGGGCPPCGTRRRLSLVGGLKGFLTWFV